jgi:hypothetical protein
VSTKERLDLRCSARRWPRISAVFTCRRSYGRNSGFFVAGVPPTNKKSRAVCSERRSCPDEAGTDGLRDHGLRAAGRRRQNRHRDHAERAYVVR